MTLTAPAVVVTRTPPRAPARSAELHPGAWWLWALGLALAASRTTNALLLGLVLAVSACVAVVCRRPSPWSRAYVVFLKIGLLAVVLRVLVVAVAGQRVGDHVLLTLPHLALPHWLAGIRLGGPVTAESLVASSLGGLQVAAMLACLGAANVVTTPSRLVKALPAALYEAGLVVTVAVSVAPQTVASLRRVRAARRLRGRPTGGLAAVRGVAVPVLEGALEQSLQLAAALDSRGYGRRVAVAAWRRHLAGAATLLGLLGLATGAYGLLGGGGAAWAGGPALAAGALCLGAGLVAGGARSPRSRYRPDRWDLRATAVAAVGVGALVVAVVAGTDPLLDPAEALVPPALPVWPAVAVVAALLPVLLSPAPVRGRDR